MQVFTCEADTFGIYSNYLNSFIEISNNLFQMYVPLEHPIFLLSSEREIKKIECTRNTFTAVIENN